MNEVAGDMRPASALDGIEWEAVCDRFRATFGRPPRALHVTNIANNAYNNAKILRARGLDGDVLCPDYYHIMGCPEWEDADFTGDVGDHFAPRWSRLSLGGFERPPWFVQGPLPLCLRYLEARHGGDGQRAERVWRMLRECNGTSGLRGEVGWLDALRIRLLVAERWFWAGLCPEVVARKVAGIAGRVSGTRSAPGRAIAQALGRAAGAMSSVGLKSVLALPAGAHLRVIADSLREELAREFPQRTDALDVEDVWYYSRLTTTWRRVFALYDLVIAYGIASINARIADARYFAMEHGTLRRIPFESTGMGRLTSLGYRAAEHVFVTNLDCMTQARELAGDRVTFINHPFDEDHGAGIGGSGELRRELCARLDADFLCFFPTRQDWVPGTGYADKANDEFLRAFASLRREGRRVGLVCCRWGSNVRDSEQLLNELGCSRHVVWYEPMGMVRFERTAKSCDVVVDQFLLGAFGGIVFKSLALGAPVCTFLDAEQVRRSFPEIPPVLNCRDAKEIASALREVMDDPVRLAALGAASRDWIKRYHSSEETARRQLDRFAAVLADRLESAGG